MLRCACAGMCEDAVCVCVVEWVGSEWISGGVCVCIVRQFVYLSGIVCQCVRACVCVRVCV